VNVEHKAATDLEVVEEVALAADQDVILLIDPDLADEIADDAFGGVVSLGVGVAGIVGEDGGAAVVVDAAGMGEALSMRSLSLLASSGVSGLPFFATTRSMRTPSTVTLSESVTVVFLGFPLPSRSCSSRWTW
jgi:hypothetical protein